LSGYSLGEQAKQDIDEIWSYIAEDNETAADRVVDSLFRQFEILAANPRIGRRRQEFRLDYRSIACDEYVIFYRVGDPDLLIVRILHGRRNLARILEP